jgi:hypothetical protein
MTTDPRAARMPGPDDVHHCCSGCKGDVHCTHGYETWWAGYDRGVRNTTEVAKAAPPAPRSDDLRAAIEALPVPAAMETPGATTAPPPYAFFHGWEAAKRAVLALLDER